jgi:hypothetical protein
VLVYYGLREAWGILRNHEALGGPRRIAGRARRRRRQPVRSPAIWSSFASRLVVPRDIATGPWFREPRCSLTPPSANGQVTSFGLEAARLVTSRGPWFRLWSHELVLIGADCRFSTAHRFTRFPRGESGKDAL